MMQVPIHNRPEPDLQQFYYEAQLSGSITAINSQHARELSIDVMIGLLRSGHIKIKLTHIPE